MSVKHIVLTCEEAYELGLPSVHDVGPDCVAIAIAEDGYVTSVSHAPADIEPTSRFNESYPDGEDYRDRLDELELVSDEAGIKLIERTTT